MGITELERGIRIQLFSKNQRNTLQYSVIKFQIHIQNINKKDKLKMTRERFSSALLTFCRKLSGFSPKIQRFETLFDNEICSKIHFRASFQYTVTKHNLKVFSPTLSIFAFANLEMIWHKDFLQHNTY